MAKSSKFSATTLFFFNLPAAIPLQPADIISFFLLAHSVSIILVGEILIDF